MQQRYGVPVLAVNCLDMTEADIRKILSNVLMEFPVKEIKVNLPRWILSLQKGHWLKTALYDAICSACGEIRRINHVAEKLQEIESCEQIAHAQVTGMDPSSQTCFMTSSARPAALPSAARRACCPACASWPASRRSTTRSRAHWRRWQPPAMAS